MSEQSLSFEARQKQKEKKRQREERRVIAGLAIGTLLFGAWLVNNGYVDNPFDLQKDASISVNDDQSQSAVQLEK